MFVFYIIKNVRFSQKILPIVLFTMNGYYENLKFMEKILRVIETYKQSSIKDVLQEISRDFDIDIEVLHQRYVASEQKPPVRCIATNKKSFRRCMYTVVPGTNFCKRHQCLSLPMNTTAMALEEERECIYRHNHPPFEINVEGCKKCEFDQKKRSTT